MDHTAWVAWGRLMVFDGPQRFVCNGSCSGYDCVHPAGGMVSEKIMALKKANNL
jgi:hypothetical protein